MPGSRKQRQLWVDCGLPAPNPNAPINRDIAGHDTVIPLNQGGHLTPAALVKASRCVCVHVRGGVSAYLTTEHK